MQNILCVRRKSGKIPVCLFISELTQELVYFVTKMIKARINGVQPDTCNLQSKSSYLNKLLPGIFNTAINEN
jgi:hypothetical protein